MDVRSEAARVLAPRFCAKEMPEAMEWTPTEKNVSPYCTYHDAKDLTSVLLAISRCDPVRAASAFAKALAEDSNKLLKEQMQIQK